MKLQRLGVFLLGVSLAIFGSMVPAQAAGSITVWVNSGEEATYKAASAAWAAKNGVTVNIVAKVRSWRLRFEQAWSSRCRT